MSQNKSVWHCKDGRVIIIKDMATDHLQNTVAMLRRKGHVTESEWLSCAAYAFSGNTPDGASMAAESELNRMIPSKQLENLEDELSHRGALI